MKIALMLFIFLSLFGRTMNITNNMKEKELIFTTTATLYAPEITNTISIYGNKMSNSPFIQNIEIKVFDNDNNLLYSFVPTINYGYSPKLTPLDFIGNGLQQIFYSADSGGSGGYGFYYVYELSDTGYKTLFDFEEFSQNNQYSGTFLDNYRAEIKTNTTTYLLDVSNMDEFYKDKIYNKDGTVKEPEIDIGLVNTVFPVFNPTQNIWFLQIYQKATAVAQVNVLGYVVNELQYENNQFTPFLQFFAIFQ